MIRYPVIGHLTGIAPVWGVGPIAVFFSYGDAIDFINAEIGGGRGYLYIGESLDDEACEENGLVEVEHLGPGRIAA